MKIVDISEENMRNNSIFCKLTGMYYDIVNYRSDEIIFIKWSKFDFGSRYLRKKDIAKIKGFKYIQFANLFDFNKKTFLINMVNDILNYHVELINKSHH